MEGVGYIGYVGFIGYKGYLGYKGYTGFLGYLGYMRFFGYVGCIGYLGFIGYRRQGAALNGSNYKTQSFSMAWNLRCTARQSTGGLGMRVGILCPENYRKLSEKRAVGKLLPGTFSGHRIPGTEFLFSCRAH